MWCDWWKEMMWSEVTRIRAGCLNWGRRLSCWFELFRPHLKLVPTSGQYSKNQSTVHVARMEREGLGKKCWEGGQFRKVVIKALHLQRASLGRGIDVVCQAFIISLNWKFIAASLGRISSYLRPQDPGLHSWPAPVAPHLRSWRPKWQDGESLTWGPHSRDEKTRKTL